MKKGHFKLYKNGWCVGLGQEGGFCVRVGGEGEILKYLKRGWNRKEGSGNILKWGASWVKRWVP